MKSNPGPTSVAKSSVAKSSVVESLAAIRQRIVDACGRAGRDPGGVTLIGASKRQPMDILRAAAEAGLETFGENQIQEALIKIPELPVDLDWHFIGTLQSNKARTVARYFSCIHSLDRPKIARVLNQEAACHGRRLQGFIQVHLGAEASKHGFPGQTGALIEAIRPLAGLQHLDIVGLMAIPPREESPDRQRCWFQELRELRDALRQEPEWRSFPGYLSMGMSRDFEMAIEEGATHVRVGSSLFGPREDRARAA